MNNVFIQKIHNHIADLPANPALDSSSMLCTTIEGNSDADGRLFWIQLHAGQINFQHLDNPEKEDLLELILTEMDAIADIEPGNYAIFDLASLSSKQVDLLLSRLVTEYFDAPNLSDPKISTEEL